MTEASVISEIDRLASGMSPAARREFLLGWIKRLERWSVAFPEYDQTSLLRAIHARVSQAIQEAA